MSKSPTTTEIRSAEPAGADLPPLALPPIHPGEILRDELDELALSANALARAIDVPTNRVTEILDGARGISADTALRLARYFGTSARLWMNLQTSYDLAIAEQERGEAIADRDRPHAA
jgi:addiction module HigA family antidote